MIAFVREVSPALAPHRPLSFIREPGTLDGGDVMRAGRDLFVGATARTNREGFAPLAGIASRARDSAPTRSTCRSSRKPRRA